MMFCSRLSSQPCPAALLGASQPPRRSPVGLFSWPESGLEGFQCDFRVTSTGKWSLMARAWRERRWSLSVPLGSLSSLGPHLGK